jgi:hypothetical protein
MALRKLREVIPDGQRPVSKRLELNVLKGKTDGSEIMDAAMVIIPSELSASKRQSLRGGFVNDITVEREWTHSYSNGRDVGVRRARHDRDFG